MRMEMDDTLGVSDWVAGFDLDFNVDDKAEFLDVYASYLKMDYQKMKTDYAYAMNILNETYQLK